jgi:hypothetical protein
MFEEVSYEAMCLELTEVASPLPTPEEALELREIQLMEEFGLTFMEAHQRLHGTLRLCRC